MDFSNFITIILTLLSLAVIIYIIGRVLAGAKIITSQIVKDPEEVEADQLYSLPAHALTLKATAWVAVSRSVATQQIRHAAVQQLSIDPLIRIEPDTKVLVTIKYTNDWFSNDQLRLTTSPTSLLENITVETEDRIGAIIAQIVNAPADATGSQVQAMNIIEQVAPPQDELLTTEIIQFSNILEISTDAAKANPVPVPWTILIADIPSGKPYVLDAGFSLEKAIAADPLTLEKQSFEGLFTRRLIQQTWTIQMPGLQQKISFSGLVPDPASLIKVPVKRPYFIKKTQLPKMANGLLVENFINKTSEVEALVSIPLRIAKAILSVPAQLLQFKIIQQKQQSASEQSLLELLQAKELTRKAQDPTAENTELKKLQQELSETKIEAEKLRALQKTPVEQEPVPKTGKLPAGEDGKVSMADAMSSLVTVNALSKALTQAPIFWSDKFTGDWQHYRNTIGGINSCVPAAAAHMITCWTANVLPPALVIPETNVIAVYSRESGFDPVRRINDKGCGVRAFLTNWITQPIGGKTISDWAPLRKNQKEDLQQAILLFGACMLGFSLPLTAQRQSDRWAIVKGANTSDTQPGSWALHAVAAVGCNDDHLLVISWGRPIKVNWDFYEMYNDESFAVLYPDWATRQRNSPAPSGQTLSDLEQVIFNLSI